MDTEQNVKKDVYGYIAFYKDKRIEVYSSDGIYSAQLKAAKLLKAKKSYEVHIVLAEKNGVPIEHTAS